MNHEPVKILAMEEIDQTRHLQWGDRGAALVAGGSAPRGKVLTMKERMAAIADRDRLKTVGNA